MNSLVNNEKQVRPYLAAQLRRLNYAYYKEDLSQEQLKKTVDFISAELKKFNRLDKRMLDETYREILEGYIYYRQFNPAVYMTAFKNVTRK
jgi:hypothetical protein